MAATTGDDVAPPAARQFATPLRLLPTMEVSEPARRRADGSVMVFLPIPAQEFLYGPFLRLPQGRYRVSFQCDIRTPLQGDHPVMGLEVIAQDKILRAWRDFTAADLRRGEQSVTFDTPLELSIEGGADAPFEFRFTHFGNALLTMRDVTLQAAPPSESLAVEADGIGAWRLLGRLKTLPRPGGVKLSPFSMNAWKLRYSRAVLRLPVGSYQVDLTCALRSARRPADKAIEIIARTRNGILLGQAAFTGRELASGHASFEFHVPMDVSLDVGAARNIDFRIRHFRNASLVLTSFDLRRLSQQIDAPALSERKGMQPDRRLDRKKIVIFGNCQGNMIAEALRDSSRFSRQFSIKHHSMELPANLHEQGKRDLEECDVLLIQDIKDWERYPLRNHVPAGLPTLRYPCIGFASLWPFDAFNGPDDRLARQRDFPNFEFTYFDGLLARLRKEIPDQELRFRAYESLQIERIIDFKRLHVFEERRLQAMDKKFSSGIGSYILDNFRRRQLFYTTAHPSGRIMTMLLREILRELGGPRLFWQPSTLNSLQRLQVPVHPRVADALGVPWADAKRKYLVRGEWITWETYFRRYISYYG